jgi:hypothetical protein
MTVMKPKIRDRISWAAALIATAGLAATVVVLPGAAQAATRRPAGPAAPVLAWKQ